MTQQACKKSRRDIYFYLGKENGTKYISGTSRLISFKTASIEFYVFTLELIKVARDEARYLLLMEHYLLVASIFVWFLCYLGKTKRHSRYFHFTSSDHSQNWNIRISSVHFSANNSLTVEYRVAFATKSPNRQYTRLQGNGNYELFWFNI